MAKKTRLSARKKTAGKRAAAAKAAAKAKAAPPSPSDHDMTEAIDVDTTSFEEKVDKMLLEEERKVAADVKRALKNMNALIKKEAGYLQSIGIDLSDIDSSRPVQPVQRSYEAELRTIQDHIGGLYEDRDNMKNQPNGWQDVLVDATTKLQAFAKANARLKPEKFMNMVNDFKGLNFGALKNRVTAATEQLSTLTLNFDVAQLWFEHVQGLLDDLKDIEPNGTRNFPNPSSDDHDGLGQGFPYATPPNSFTVEIPVKPATRKPKTSFPRYEATAVPSKATQLQAQMDNVKSGLISIWEQKIEPGKAKYHEAREVFRKFEIKYKKEGTFLAKETGTGKKGKKRGADATMDEPLYHHTTLEYYDTSPFHDVELKLGE
ncbi:hypothetical protein ABW21_db0204861 [Orbilia brochopaga]|nr:hypothetical protein ABW21_db0204861 [Drechslerella brochopaga]